MMLDKKNTNKSILEGVYGAGYWFPDPELVCPGCSLPLSFNHGSLVSKFKWLRVEVQVENVQPFKKYFLVNVVLWMPPVYLPSQIQEAGCVY